MISRARAPPRLARTPEAPFDDPLWRERSPARRSRARPGPRARLGREGLRRRGARLRVHEQSRGQHGRPAVAVGKSEGTDRACRAPVWAIGVCTALDKEAEGVRRRAGQPVHAGGDMYTHDRRSHEKAHPERPTGVLREVSEVRLRSCASTAGGKRVHAVGLGGEAALGERWAG